MFIFPSAPFQTTQELQTIFQQLDAAAPGYHIDIMDGHFVPKTMGSISLTHQIRTLTKKKLWVHLMVINPLEYLTELKLQPGDIITAHHEALTGKHETFAKIAHSKNLSPSLAANPETSILTLVPFLPYFDAVLLMSVKPGKAGQPFLPSTFNRITELHKQFKKQNSRLPILIDGGVTAELIPQLQKCGIHAVAATSAIFTENDYLNALKKLQSLS